MTTVTYIEAITQALDEEMARDPRVFLLGEDIGLYGGVFKATKGLQQKYGPLRVIDTPISEAFIVGGSVGAAMAGMKPVPEIQFSDFITPAMDQIIQQLAKMRYRTGGKFSAPAVVRVCCGAEVGGGLYHSQTNEAWFAGTAGLKVVMPSTPYDAKGLLKAAIRGDDPVIYFEHKRLYRSVKGEIPDEDYTVPIGQAVVRRPGQDLTIVAYGLMMQKVLEAAPRLVAAGIDPEIIDLRSLLPIDWPTLFASVKKTARVLLVQEAPKSVGVMAEVAARISEEVFDYLDAPPARVCGLDVPPVPFAPPMEHFVLPQPDRIEAAAKGLRAY
jgi:2-oxoisovalerate dehydrogenase E1 component beta subunit